MPTSPRLRSSLLAALVAAAVALSACGGSGGSSGATTTTVRMVSMPAVVASLPVIAGLAHEADVAAQRGDFDTALNKYAIIHDDWLVVESTVKATDRAAYETIETAQSLMKDGAEKQDAERVATGVADQAAAFDAFIAENG